MGEVNFPNYENFVNFNDAYWSLIEKLMEIINKIVPVKNKRIKRNSQKWFDSEISEEFIIQDNFFRKCKTS